MLESAANRKPTGHFWTPPPPPPLGLILVWNSSFFKKDIIPMWPAYSPIDSPLHITQEEAYMHYIFLQACFSFSHGLRTPSEEIVFTARPKIQSQSQIFRYGQKDSLSATLAQFFRYLWFMPSLGVRSPGLSSSRNEWTEESVYDIPNDPGELTSGAPVLERRALCFGISFKHKSESATTIDSPCIWLDKTRTNRFIFP